MATTCIGCNHRKAPAEGEQVGSCIRNPPTVFIVPVQTPPTVSQPNGGTGIGVNSYFPPVHDTWTCGAFMAKPKIAT